MNDKIIEVIENWEKDLKFLISKDKIKDEALYWASKMTQLISILEHSSLVGISDKFELLCKVKNIYDQIIFSRVK